MTNDTELLKRRLVELGKKSHGSGIFLFSCFLGLAEQSALSEVSRELFGIRYEVFGGCEGAERVMVRFGDPEEIGYELPFPITALRIAPKSPRFAEKLTHRDFLGALMNLGIERDVLGDIIVTEGAAYLFAKDDIAPYIEKELTRVRRTDVTVSPVLDLPEGELYRTEVKRIQLSGERLDAVIAKTYNLSREEAQRLFPKGLVFASGRCIESTSYVPKVGEKISVRGYGRLIYRGYESTSRKGKLNVTVEVYV